MDVLAAADPVAAVLAAHAAPAEGTRLRLRTSGTGGSPRWVVRSPESWFRSFAHVSRLSGISHRSRVWIPGPLSATMNLFSAVHARHEGATLVQAPTEATHAVLTPAGLLRSLASLPAGLHVLVAGDRLDHAQHGLAVERGLRVSHYYGAAELSFVAWGSHAQDLHPFPEVDVVERAGTLWVRSPFVALGYDGSSGSYVRDEAGWATVGDLGELRGGRVVVHGRGDQAITTSGATVLVSDVESTLRPAARGQVVVVPVHHPELGAVVGAVLTEPADHPVLHRLARTRLDAVSRPRLWFHVPTLPLGPAGKIDRSALADGIARGAIARLPALVA